MHLNWHHICMLYHNIKHAISKTIFDNQTRLSKIILDMARKLCENESH